MLNLINAEFFTKQFSSLKCDIYKLQSMHVVSILLIFITLHFLIYSIWK